MLAVEVDAELAQELIAAGVARGGPDVGGPEGPAGAMGEIAAYAAVIAGHVATIVALTDVPEAVRRVGSALSRRGRDEELWLRARGPAGEITLRLSPSPDQRTLAALLAALWDTGRSDQAPYTADEDPDAS